MMHQTNLTDPIMTTPISQVNAPETFANLVHNFMRRPYSERIPLLLKLTRGLLASHVFDESSWPLFERGARISKRNGWISIGRFVTFCGNTQIAVAHRGVGLARLSIGEFTSIGPSTIINVSEEVYIGKRCLISWNCDIMDTDFHEIVSAENKSGCSVSAPVCVGDDVWIGAHSIVLKGTTIGNNCVIGAGSIVSGNIPSNSLAAGNPAQVLRRIAGWKR
jgi:acetyltransferase-like isoleucine patch superfamily enzyme